MTDKVIAYSILSVSLLCIISGNKRSEKPKKKVKKYVSRKGSAEPILKKTPSGFLVTF